MNKEDEKYFMGRDILTQCYSYNQLYYFYRELGLKGIDRYINELQNESKSKSREIERLIISLQAQEELTMNEHIKVERLNNIINELEKYGKQRFNEYEAWKEECKNLCYINGITEMLDKLQELKGVDNNK